MTRSVFATRFKTADKKREHCKKRKDRYFLSISRHETLHFDCVKDFLEVLSDFKNSNDAKVVR